MSSDGTVIFSPMITKPIIAGIACAMMDKLILKKDNMMSNATFGASVAFGTLIGDGLGGALSSVFPDTNLYIIGGKTLAQRATEITVGAGTAYAINMYVLENDLRPSEMANKLGVIALSQFIGEYGSDYFAGQPLAYFQ